MEYPTNLTDKQWQVIELFVGRPDPRGARPKYERRNVINAILYLNKTGCQWRMLPGDFPPWQCVYDHFRRMKQRGVWQEICWALNELDRKKKGGRRCPAIC
ncbi:MAG: transposase [Verrucomicrobiota bacterium]